MMPLDSLLAGFRGFGDDTERLAARAGHSRAPQGPPLGYPPAPPVGPENPVAFPLLPLALWRLQGWR